jgi:hypothetical protein
MVRPILIHERDVAMRLHKAWLRSGRFWATGTSGLRPLEPAVWRCLWTGPKVAQCVHRRRRSGRPEALEFRQFEPVRVGQPGTAGGRTRDHLDEYF